MKVKNKWNSKIYNVVEIKDTSIILERTDGSTIEIDKSEFNFSYRIIENQVWDNGWDKLNIKEELGMGFFKKTWVEIVAIVMFVVSIILLALGGFAKADVAPIFEAVFAVLDVISLLILAIKKLLQKKDTANK